MIFLWIFLALVAAVGAGLLLYFFCSPMPIVRLLRKGGDAPASWPEGEEDAAEHVKVEYDLSYASSYGRNRYDLYLPGEDRGPAPLLLWIHGGAFVAGDKTGVKNWASCLAAKGMAVAAVEYQWAPEAHWPAQVCQIGECYRELEKTAAAKGLNLDQIVIAGDSAGAHMAAQFALVHTSGEFCTVTGLSPVLRAGALKAVLLFCGPYDIGQMARPDNRFLRLAMHRVGWSYLGKRRWQDSPAAKATVIKNYVTPDFPPAYITDGSRGSFDRQGRALAEALKQAGVAVTGLFFGPEEEEAVHEYQFDLARPLARRCYDEVCAFLQERRLMNERKNPYEKRD